MSTRTFLLLPRLSIHNANAISSPYTIGFPAMSAWLGAMHALQRKLQTQWPVQLSKLAISCHQFALQTYKGKNDFVHSIVGTANPLDKDGKRPPFIEEARCHLTVSLLIEIHPASDMDLGIEDTTSRFIKHITQLLNTMKFAGGDLLPLTEPVQIIHLDKDDINNKSTLFHKMIRTLMPGYVLQERRDILINALNSQSEDKPIKTDILNILLDQLSIHHQPVKNQESETTPDKSVEWHAQRLNAGWLVPIAVGFQGISPLGHAQNQRDPDTLHRFAESVVTLSEFIMPLPHRIENLDELFWHYHIVPENNLYLCRNQTISVAN